MRAYLNETGKTRVVRIQILNFEIIEEAALGCRDLTKDEDQSDH
jgi:hypothetical protein